MYQPKERYIFSGCSNCSKANPAVASSCGCGVRAAANNELARIHFTMQRYENCASPEYALKNGTFFNELYMPYRVQNDCCTSVMDAKCLRNCNMQHMMRGGGRNAGKK